VDGRVRSACLVEAGGRPFVDLPDEARF